MSDGEILHVDTVQLAVGSRMLVECLNLCIEPGQLWCVLGPNGSGKTTLLRTLSGLQPPNAGRIRLGVRDISEIRSIELARLRGFLPQSITDVFSITVFEAVLSARHPRLPFWAWGDVEAHIAIRALKMFELEQIANRDITTLSGGERQRVNIAALFAQEVDIMVLDEPLSSLDLHHQMKVLSELVNATELTGKSIIYTAHDINLAYQHSTHAIILNGQGQALAGRTTDVITAQPLSNAYAHPIDRITLEEEPFFRAKRLCRKQIMD